MPWTQRSTAWRPSFQQRWSEAETRFAREFKSLGLLVRSQNRNDEIDGSQNTVRKNANAVMRLEQKLERLEKQRR